MKKLFALLMLVLATGLVSAKGCDWSKVQAKQITQFRNYYKFQVKELDSDSCTEFFWIFKWKDAKGNYQYDTFGYNSNVVDFNLNLKGTFLLTLKAINSCNKCDTTWKFELNQAVFGNDATWSYKEKSCKEYVFEANKLKTQKEECIQVYWFVFDNDGNEVHYDSGYRFQYTFPWEGKFEVYTQWWNKCLNQDTFWGRNLDIFCDSSTNRLVPINPSARGMARPNPTSCEFYISNTRGVHEYMIVNPAGTIIAVGKTDLFEEVRIETCLWPNGVYYLLVEGLGRELIMIQH